MIIIIIIPLRTKIRIKIGKMGSRKCILSIIIKMGLTIDRNKDKDKV